MSDTLILISAVGMFFLMLAALVAIIQTAGHTKKAVEWLQIMHRELELNRKTTK